MVPGYSSKSADGEGGTSREIKKSAYLANVERGRGLNLNGQVGWPSSEKDPENENKDPSWRKGGARNNFAAHK